MLSHTSSFLSGAKLSVTNGDNGSLAAGFILICWNGHWIDIGQSIYKNRIKLILSWATVNHPKGFTRIKNSLLTVLLIQGFYWGRLWSKAVWWAGHHCLQDPGRRVRHPRLRRRLCRQISARGPRGMAFCCSLLRHRLCRQRSARGPWGITCILAFCFSLHITVTFCISSEVSLIAPVFTISVYGSSCKPHFFSFILAPLLSLSI